MDDDILQRFAAASQVSLRAVLAEDGEDVSAALSQAGMFDAVAVPVVIGADPDLPGGILGNGMTSNLTGTLEPDEADAFEDFDAGSGNSAGRQEVGTSGPPPGGTVTLPAAFGRQPMAPVRRAGPQRSMAAPDVRKPSGAEGQADPGVPIRLPDGRTRPDQHSPNGS